MGQEILRNTNKILVSYIFLCWWKKHRWRNTMPQDFHLIFTQNVDRRKNRKKKKRFSVSNSSGLSSSSEVPLYQFTILSIHWLCEHYFSARVINENSRPTISLINKLLKQSCQAFGNRVFTAWWSTIFII